jgi:hypothetical protein
VLNLRDLLDPLDPRDLKDLKDLKDLLDLRGLLDLLDLLDHKVLLVPPLSRSIRRQARVLRFPILDKRL